MRVALAWVACQRIFSDGLQFLQPWACDWIPNQLVSRVCKFLWGSNINLVLKITNVEPKLTDVEEVSLVFSRYFAFRTAFASRFFNLFDSSYLSRHAETVSGCSWSAADSFRIFTIFFKHSLPKRARGWFGCCESGLVWSFKAHQDGGLDVFWSFAPPFRSADSIVSFP